MTDAVAQMTGKERVLAAMAMQELDRPPWVPFVGCHAGALLGMDAEQFLKSEDAIVNGVNEGIKRYNPDGVPIVFDLQIEAEVLGCGLNWAKDNPPSVVSHPLASGKTLADLKIPQPDQGRVATAIAATRRLRKDNPDIALYGLITGPFTLTLHLMGTDIFMRMFDAPGKIQETMDFARQVCQTMADYYIEAGADIIAVVDPMTSQIGPDQFREFVTPHISPVFEHIRSLGARGSFFVCGHAQQNIKAMCECKPDNVSIDENIGLQYVRDICLEDGISFGGNMQLTTVLLLGKPEDAQRNALECLEIGGNKGFLLAPGCDLPYATPPENLEAVNKIVTDPYEQEVLRAKAVEETDIEKLDMREYGQTDKVIVDIITLDSEGCAPCQYMVESVKDITPEFEGIVEWREHKIKYKESLVFMTSLMVKNIPTICIDGKITFVSRIPGRDELIAAIQRRIYEKLRMRIRRSRGSLLVFGPEGDQKTADTIERASQAVQELGSDIAVKHITDEKTWADYGILPKQCPATVLVSHRVKSTASVPDIGIVKEWVKDLR